ncbi:MAG: hypothetical protein H6599_00750 [Flavobacteriales bacterium]|nr:hypothetical protein [Flavobacteriales bacterium]
MKTPYYYFLGLFFLFFHINGNAQTENFIEIPELSKKIIVKGDAVKYDKAIIKILRDDTYDNGVVFGSWLQMEVTGIHEMNTFDGYSFLLSKSSIKRKSDGFLIVDNHWSTDGDDEDILLANGSNDVVYTEKLNTGSPMFSGIYVWTLEFADICSGKRTSFSVDLKIISSPFIENETKGNMQFDEVFLYNDESEFIYTTDTLFTGDHSLTFRNLHGMVLKDSIAKLGLEITLKNEKGETLDYKEDIISGSDAFIEAADFIDKNLNYEFSLIGEDIGHRLYLTVRVWDKEDPKNEITTKTNFYVIK